MSRFVPVLEQLQGYAPQLCMKGDGHSYTYAQMLEELECWQSRFDELNIAPGSVVGVRADYSLAAVAALLALFARRAIAALIPRDRDAAHYLVDARAAALIELNVDGHYQCIPYRIRQVIHF